MTQSEAYEYLEAASKMMKIGKADGYKEICDAIDICLERIDNLETENGQLKINASTRAK
jgi:hypothetical protein